MDMSLEDTLAALGLNDEATVSQRTVGDGGGNFFTIPSGRSRNYREDSTLTPGQTPFAPGTPGVTWTLSAGRGTPLALLGDLGQHTVVLAPQLCGSTLQSV